MTKTRLALQTAAATILASALLPFAAFANHSPITVELTPIGSFSSGGVGAAEISAFDPKTKRLFVVNFSAAAIDVLDLSDPTQPKKLFAIDVKPYGASANSVAVRDGLVAVAVEASPKTDPGKAVFFDADGKFINAVTVGALPDMLTFTPNGQKVLVANEGEPNDDYSVDPLGSVSIIDLKGGAKNLTQANVKQVTFESFDNNGSLDASIRIFGQKKSGEKSTLAEDLEPEYIAVSHDSKKAWVTCQENNAIAVLDIEAGVFTDLFGLGFKDHNLIETTLKTYEFQNLPVLGKTEKGQEILLGGFSGLWFEGKDPSGKLNFVTHTDRGPNAEPTGLLRPFLLPNFTPEIVRFEVNPHNGKVTIKERIPLRVSKDVKLTGLPNITLGGGAANSPYNDETPVDLFNQMLPLDPLGADLEGIVVDKDGSFWMVDEYRPAIYHFDAKGVLIKRYVPIGTAAAAGKPAGTYGEEVLPAVLAQRRQNRGFEALAMDGGKLYAFIQSPLRNPATLSNATLNGMRNIRIVEFDPATNATKQYIYIMDNPNLGGVGNTRADKIGDAVALSNGEFLVIERDDDAVPDDPESLIEKKIYRFKIGNATDVSAFTGNVGATGKTVDQLTQAELLANGIRPIAKTLYADLNTVGYNKVQKVEGLALIDKNTVAVLNDNDFGVSDITIDTNAGTFERNSPPEPIVLGIINVLGNNALDASDRDNAINITNWPVKGMYQPDGIAAFRHKGQTFLITANEGDAREWGAFNEEARVSSLTLDPTKFPNAATLKQNANLGRLTVTNKMGDWDNDGDFDELFVFGARSVSIWTEFGQLVWDSGDTLERITAASNPADFNSNNNANGTFDTRSDNKGPEPEDVKVAQLWGRTFAFVGLERIGGVVVFDITDPCNPDFVQYINTRNFTGAPGDLGPEGLLVIEAHDSPTKNPLLVVCNEISGTIRIFEIRKVIEDNNKGKK
jgi:hypothetical protein